MHTLERFLTWAALHPLHTEFEITQEDDGSGFTVLTATLDTGPPIQITITDTPE